MMLAWFLLFVSVFLREGAAAALKPEADVDDEVADRMANFPARPSSRQP